MKNYSSQPSHFSSSPQRDPKEFLEDFATLEKMLMDAVEGPHPKWTRKDLEDITRRVREKRVK
jgi:hypothetical protein